MKKIKLDLKLKVRTKDKRKRLMKIVCEEVPLS